MDEVDFPMLVVPRGCVKKKLQCSLKKDEEEEARLGKEVDLMELRVAVAA